MAEPDRKAEGEDLRAELSRLIRLYQRDIDQFDQAVADRLVVNRTDLRCLDILVEEAIAGGQITPKDLAERSGMSPSAITTVLDRLERSGYARRVRDQVNRRRVTVTLTPLVGKLTEEIFAPVAAAGEAQVAGYSTAELRTLVDFFSRAHALHIRRVQSVQEGRGR